MSSFISNMSDDPWPYEHRKELTQAEIIAMYNAAGFDGEAYVRGEAARKARRTAEEAEAESKAAARRAKEKMRQRARRSSIAELGYCDPGYCASYRAEHALEKAPLTAKALVAKAEREPVGDTQSWLAKLRASEGFSRHTPEEKQEFVRRVKARGERTESVRMAHWVVMNFIMEIEQSKKWTLYDFVNCLHKLKLEPVLTKESFLIRYADGTFIEDYGGGSERLGKLLDLLIGGGGQYTPGTPWYDLTAMRLHYLKRSNRAEDLPENVQVHILPALNSLPHDELIGAIDSAFDANPLPLLATERLAHLVRTLHNRMPLEIAPTVPDPQAAPIRDQSPGEAQQSEQNGAK